MFNLVNAEMITQTILAKLTICDRCEKRKINTREIEIDWNFSPSYILLYSEKKIETKIVVVCDNCFYDLFSHLKNPNILIRVYRRIFK